MQPESLTPEEIVQRLDRHIVGQDQAKRSVAVALRNRWRRRQLPYDLAQEIYPKNILLIGPTGVGKTEIARRLAQLAKAPFLKVEASKYSEVGYHGRDVESMVRDLTEVAIAMVRREKSVEVQEKAQAAARHRILEALYGEMGLSSDEDPGMDALMDPGAGEVQFVSDGGLWRPVIVPPGEEEPTEGAAGMSHEEIETRQEEREQKRLEIRERFEAGSLHDQMIFVELRDSRSPTLSIRGPQGTDTMGIDAEALQELWGRGGGPKFKTRKLTVKDAYKALLEEESHALIDEEECILEAVDRVQNDGILFIDEIDKVIGGSGANGPDVSREGVQRDLLTVVEGCTVFTKYGDVDSSHILFLAAGAFHFHKPSELIPELQGRFPVRVALSDLGEDDFLRILVEPANSLTEQYKALLSTEDVSLSFTEDGLAEIAAVAFKANKTTQNIGARRLMTTMERLLEQISYEAPQMQGKKVLVDKAFVQERLGDAGDDPELIKYMI